MEIVNHIEIRDGTGYITGRNVKAKMVARMYIWEKASIEEVMGQYRLTPAEVHDAIAYYYDNQEELDAEYNANIELLKRTGTSSDKLKAIIAERQQSQDED